MSPKLIGAFVFLAGSALGNPQTSGLVTMELKAAPLSQVVDRISEATGEPLLVSTQLANEIVVVRVTEEKPEELLKRIALVVGGSWRETSAGRQLYLTEEQRKKEISEELSYRVNALRRAILKLSEPLKKNPEFNEAVAAQVRGSSQDPLAILQQGGMNAVTMANLGRNLISGSTDQPAGRAIARLAQVVDINSLARLENGDRIVFSTNPNRLQAALPLQARGIIQRLVAEQQVWAEANLGDEANTNTDRLRTAIFGGRITPINAPPVKALLSVQRQGLLDGFELRLRLYAADGSEVYSGSQTLLLDSSPLNLLDQMGDLREMPGTDIELSDRSKELLGFFRNVSTMAFGGGSVKPISPDLLALLKRPDLHDPLGYLHGEALLALSTSQKKDLIGVLPDSILAAAAFMLPGQKLTLASFLKQIQESNSVRFEETEDCFFVWPIRRLSERERRLNRKALASLIANVKEDGSIRLSHLAAYAVNNPPFMESPVGQQLLTVLVPSVLTNPSANNWDLLRLWGSLGLAQQNRLADGQAIPFSELSQTQLGLIRSMVYRPSALGLSGLVVEGPTNPSAVSALGEPTEVLPNGLPVDGTLSVNVNRTDVVSDAGDKKPFLTVLSTFAAEELGALQGLREKSGLGQMLAGFLPDLKSFRMGTRTTYRVTIQLLPDVSLVSSLQDTDVAENGRIFAYGELPQEFREKAAKAMEMMSNLSGLEGLFGGGSAPPKP